MDDEILELNDRLNKENARIEQLKELPGSRTKKKKIW